MAVNLIELESGDTPAATITFGMEINAKSEAHLERIIGFRTRPALRFRIERLQRLHARLGRPCPQAVNRLWRHRTVMHAAFEPWIAAAERVVDRRHRMIANVE